MIGVLMQLFKSDILMYGLVQGIVPFVRCDITLLYTTYDRLDLMMDNNSELFHIHLFWNEQIFWFQRSLVRCIG